MKRQYLVLWLGLVTGATPLQADTSVTFNEVMYHPVSNESVMEWVEFRNQMAVDVDVSGWSIDGGIQYTFPSNTVVRGRSLILVAVAPETLKSVLGLTNVFGPFSGRLNNSGETLLLRNNSGRLVDEITYAAEGDWPVGPDGSGVSLAKRDGETASGPAANWSASQQKGGTPGAQNFFLGSVPEVTLMSVEQPWRIEPTGADPGPAWRQPGFNDSSWTSRAPLTNRSLTTLFSTGISTNRTPLASGQRDPHYLLTASAQGGPQTNAIVMLQKPGWLANNALSTWIGVTNLGSASVAAGNYSFQTTFSLDGFLPDTAQLSLAVGADDRLNAVLLNGTSAGISHVGFAALSAPFLVTSGFGAGTNTLEFLAANDGTSPSSSGFRVLATGTALAPNTNAPLPGGRVTYYFRKTFSYFGDPAFSELRLRTLVADGAVIYLNGVEVHRQNLPGGPLSASTPALSDVTSPTLSAPFSIPTTALLAGANALAIEVHQATANTGEPLVGIELLARPLPLPEIALAFNETAPATNQNFFVELINYGTNTLSLGDFVLVQDGVTNRTLPLPPGSLAPGALVAISNEFNGVFAPGDKLYLEPISRARVTDGAVLKRTLRGRIPAATGPFLFPSRPTPGEPNVFNFQTNIVINEILYHHKRLPSTNGLPPYESAEAWIELFNRGSNTIDLTGWQIDGGVSYSFSSGQTIASGAYLVVAEDAAALRADYPSVEIIGNLGGRLSRGGDLIVLRDPVGNPGDQVHYRDGAPWPDYADGGGSSLELRDPNADNSRPEAWADSDESNKTEWQTYTYRSTAVIPATLGVPTRHNEFNFGLLDAGECLIDDISVQDLSQVSGPVQMVANGDFESGLSGWRAIGTHGPSRVEVDPDNAANHVLHLVATGPQEHMHNHIERTSISNRVVVASREYQISFRARWLAGNNFLNTRLYFNRVARTTTLPVPVRNGTPGGPNSRRVPNIGPTFSGLSHTPVVPQPNEPVTVSVIAEDPQGVSSAELWRSTNGGAWTSTPMSTTGGGRYTGTISGFPAGTIVQFYVQAADSLGANATYPAAGRDSGALYAVAAAGQANLNLGHNLRIVLTPNNANLMHAPTNVMSNDDIPGTLIYDESRAYYNVGIRLKGSEHGRYHDERASWHLGFPSDDPFRGVHPIMLVDRSGAGDTSENKQSEILVKHILLRAGNIPGVQTDMSRVIAPRTRHTGPCLFFPRLEDEFVETAYENGGDGTLWELELIYVLVGTNQFGYKLPGPDEVVGTDIQNLGDNKEFYRYNFMLKTHRDADDYSRFITLAKTFSAQAGMLDAQVPQVMDIDQWARAFALTSLCGIGDTYSFGNNHNLFMYVRPSDQRFVTLPADMDFAFARGASDALIGDQNLGRIFNQPAFRRLVFAHAQDIIATSFNSSYMSYWIPHYQSFAPGQNYAPISSYINSRAASINSQIGNAVFSVTTPASITTNGNLITLTGIAPVSVRTIRINGKDYPITWNSNTGWTIRVPISDAATTLVVQPIDMRGNPLTNLTKTVTVNYTGPIPDPNGAIAINEIMYNPTAPDAAYVELINTSNFSFDLSGWRINALDFTFPNGSLITNRGFFVVAASRPSYARAYGTNPPAASAEFPGNLQNDGETLTLFRPGPAPGQEIVMDQVRYEGTAPWPVRANGGGSSLQLIDPAQSHSRVANWADGTGWRLHTFTGIPGSPLPTNLLMSLSATGAVYIDNVSLVAGSNATAGVNLLANGGFEDGAAPWLFTGDHINSAVVNDVAFEGSRSLRVVAGTTNGGFSQLFAEPLGLTSPYTLSFWFLPSTNGVGIRSRISSSFTNTVDYRPLFLTPGRPNPSAGVLPPFPLVWLNEVQPENFTGQTDNQGEPEPWIEIYNAGPDLVRLDGYYLANDYSTLNQWPFPAGATLKPGEFKIVFADGEPGESTADVWHTNFRLSRGSGAVALSWTPSKVQILDYLTYSAITPGRSYGDYPNGQPFDRQHFHFVTPGAPNNSAAPPVVVRINEWMASNSQTLINTNNSNRFDDWIELYNPGSLPANIGGYYLTDNLLNKFQYQIPAGYVIPAEGFLLVWADSQPGANSTYDPDLHVNFRLDQDGEQIGLFASDGTLIDAITFEPQFNDVSQGRVPDGTGPGYFMALNTPREPNSTWGNRYPVLGPIADSILFAGRTLAFSVDASDPDSPGQALTFSLDPGAPVGATIDPSDGAFSWTTPNLAATNRITIRATDSGFPELSVSRTFQVAVRTSFRVTGLTRLPNGSAVLTVGAIPGETYRIEFKDNLSAAEWTPILPDRLADSESLTVIDPNAGGQHRFYRVRQLP